jgi:hypothetical protein
MPLAGFEPTIPVFEKAKTLHALDRTASVIGKLILNGYLQIMTMNDYSEFLLGFSIDFFRINLSILFKVDSRVNVVLTDCTKHYRIM